MSADEERPSSPETAWWTIHGQCIRDALERVASGDHPEVVWLELVADCEVDR
jgi:hypothetical protein